MSGAASGAGLTLPLYGSGCVIHFPCVLLFRHLNGGVHISAHVHESKCFFQLYGLKNPTHMYFSNHIL